MIEPKNPIPLFKVFMAPTAKDKVGEVLESGYIGQGPIVDEFENQLGEYFGNKKVVTFNAGTSALHLALHLLKKPKEDWHENVYDGIAWAHHNWPGIQDGDEVLATPLTCTASNWPIVANNLKIKWVDIDPTTLNMDLEDLERKMTPKTKAIMGVHWGGYPLDLDKIQDIKKRFREQHGWAPVLIEDGAHSIGTKYKGKYLGNHGNFVMNSFQAIKHITSVDGGLLYCPHEELYERAKLLRWYGIDRNPKGRTDFRCEADIPEWGFKFHMNDVCAAIGIENFKHIDEIVNKHKENASYYDEHLKDVEGVTLLKREEGFESAFWIYSLLVDDRPSFYKYMKEKNITVSQVHERNDKHSCMSEFKSDLPNLDKTIGHVVSIPVGWWVTEEERKYIVHSIKEWKKIYTNAELTLSELLDTNEHLEFLLQIRNDDSTRFQLENNNLFTLDQCKQWYSKLTDKWKLIKVGGVNVGYVRLNGTDIGIDIHPHHRKRGYARRAYELYLKENRNLTLWVFEDNHAKKLYEDLGFKPNGESKVIRERNYIRMVLDG